MTREQVREALSDQMTYAAEHGDKCAQYGDWSGPSDEDKLFDLVIAALERLGAFN